MGARIHVALISSKKNYCCGIQRLAKPRIRHRLEVAYPAGYLDEHFSRDLMGLTMIASSILAASSLFLLSSTVSVFDGNPSDLGARIVTVSSRGHSGCAFLIRRG